MSLEALQREHVHTYIYMMYTLYIYMLGFGCVGGGHSQHVLGGGISRVHTYIYKYISIMSTLYSYIYVYIYIRVRMRWRRA